MKNVKQKTFYGMNATFFLFAHDALAQATHTTEGLNEAAGKAGFGHTAPTVATIVSGIVNAVLGLSGIAFFVLFVWGGIQYLLSQGEADRVKNAKATLMSAAIGLVIIITAFALVKFLFGTLGAVLGSRTQPSG